MYKQILLPILLFSSLYLSAQNGKFPPKDDTGKDPELAAFVAELKSVVAAKDTSRLIPLLDPAVQTAWDGEHNIKTFKDLWRLDDSDSSMLWPLLDRVLSLGGAFSDMGKQDPRFAFVFPYVYNLELEDPDQYFSVAVITGQNVNLREEPNLEASVRGKLSYDVVSYVLSLDDEYRTSGQNDIGEPEWYMIKTDSGKSGWVYWKYIYAPVNWRLFLAKVEGKWKITCFIAGD